MDRAEILKRLNEIKRLKKKIANLEPGVLEEKAKNSKPSEFENGISVIIPTYKGADVILTCLKSLNNQTLDPKLFEVIIVINGEKDNTETIIQKFIEENNMNNIKLEYSSMPSASNARNIGIQLATRKYSVFLDDDDYLSSNYLEEMYNLAEEDSIIISQIVNVDPNGLENRKNSINNEIVSNEKKENSYQTLHKVATINACKLIPTSDIKNIKFDTSLKSGEDVVFFSTLYAKKDFNFHVIPIKNNAIYYRVLTANSVSRQEMTFDFNVNQRLQVIEALNHIIEDTKDIRKRSFIKQKIIAQAMFINRYLKRDFGDREKVMSTIRSYNLNYIPYEYINKGFSEKVVISYCFPPYADTSGNVMAKRLRDMNEVVDVVYNKMDNVREIDKSLNLLVDDLIENRIEIPTYPSFSNWKAINDFCDVAMNKLIDKQYKEIYSRVLWPGSHILAYKYKLHNPKTKWIAEFSDPIILDIEGKERFAKIDDDQFVKTANKLIRKNFRLPKVKSNNLFFWCEYLPYIYADELIFTNENQFNYMMDNFPIHSVRKMIEQKAKIKPHPSLPKEYYQIRSSHYKVDQEKINVAYFGNFYKTRDLNDLFLGLEGLSEVERKKLTLHIFTANPEDLKLQLSGKNINDCIKVNPYVDYMEFLHLTTIFDCLVVNDANTKQYKSINPYLPSKLSDYLGSGADIWGIYEKDSILSSYSLSYKSELGNIDETIAVFKQLVNKH